jgi:hypothetical protein
MRVATGFLLFALVTMSTHEASGDEPKAPADPPPRRVPALEGWSLRLSPDKKLAVGMRAKLDVRHPLYGKFKDLPDGLRVWSTDEFKEQWSLPSMEVSNLAFTENGTRLLALSDCPIWVGQADFR